MRHDARRVEADSRLTHPRCNELSPPPRLELTPSFLTSRRSADPNMRVLGLALLVGTATAAIELNAANFDSSVEGKNAFVKFLAPW